MVADALGRAMLDFQRGGLCGNCLHRDGDSVADARIYGFYFRPPETWSGEFRALLDSLDGPVLDAGCGPGRQARWLQDRGREVVAIDSSPHAVQAAREHGVRDARVMDMFGLAFPRDRFRSVLVNGTQVGLAGSLAGVSTFLGNIARVTDAEGRAVVDSYAPRALDPEGCFGYRSDPRPGVARRTFHVEYHREGPDGEVTRDVGRTLQFVLFGPDRLAEAAVGTPWRVTEVRPQEAYYRAVLEK